jgi:hypothetical protein
MMKSNYVMPMKAKEKKYYDIANRLYKRNSLPRRIRKSRGLRRFNNLGRFYVLDIYTNTVIDSHIDVFKWSSNMIINDYNKRMGIVKQGSRGHLTIYGSNFTEEGQKIDYSGLFD